MPSALNSRTAMGAHGDSEAVAATVLTAVSLVPRQVVFGERVDGLSKRKFSNRHCFSTFDTHIIEQRQSNSSLFGRCKKNRRRTKAFVPTVAAVTL
jgi:hypothetical protein